MGLECHRYRMHQSHTGPLSGPFISKELMESVDNQILQTRDLNTKNSRRQSGDIFQIKAWGLVRQA